MRNCILPRRVRRIQLHCSFVEAAMPNSRYNRSTITPQKGTLCITLAHNGKEVDE